MNKLQIFALNIEKYIAILLLPAVSFLFVNSADIFSIIYGEKFILSGKVFQILIIQVYFFIMLTPYSTQLTAMERLKPILYFGIVSQGLNIILNLILIPKELLGIKMLNMGAFGSATSILVSTFLSTLLYRIYLIKKTGLKINYSIFGYAGIAFATYYLPQIILSEFHHISYFLRPFLSLFISTPLYFGVLLLSTLLKREDINFYLEFAKLKAVTHYIKDELQEKNII